MAISQYHAVYAAFVYEGHPVAKGGVSISEERQQAELAWVTVLASLWETVLDFSNFIWAYVCCQECTQFPASAPSLLHHFVSLNCDRGCCTSDSLLALWERTSTEPGERGMHQPRNGPPLEDERPLQRNKEREKLTDQRSCKVLKYGDACVERKGG
ncbi:hypothetical protein QTO34_006900 [Cnephaeus nilssonii]|uniref:Uncharacterized protein n=1 Tax=Cnephaeus nilssonii TaxID=3371016 RepID=A0AA40HJC5_CNENI|nr:hypothetical protein QTO34_006900 [Eptesicus nilssonii]